MTKKEKAIVYSACTILATRGEKEDLCSCYALFLSGDKAKMDLRNRYSNFYEKPGLVRWWPKQFAFVHERIMALLFFAEAENDV